MPRDKGWKPQHHAQPPSSSKAKQKKLQQKERTNSAQQGDHTTIESSSGGGGGPLSPPPQTREELLQIPLFFLTTFRHILLSTPSLPDVIQRVKQHLYNRDYVAAFGSVENLEAYVARWSVSRAMAYKDMVVQGWWGEEVKGLFLPSMTSSSSKATALSRRNDKDGGKDDDDDGNTEVVKVCCLGGGAGAEIVGFLTALQALNGWNRHTIVQEELLSPSSSPEDHFETITKAIDETDIEDKQEKENEEEEEEEEEERKKNLLVVNKQIHLTLLDFASWAPIVQTISNSISDVSKEHGIHVLPPTSFNTVFEQQDILQPLSSTSLSSIKSANVITLLFTVGELYTQSPTLSTKFLLSLANLVQIGTHLVVVDSAGGFEDVNVRKEQKSAEGSTDSSSTTDVTGFKLGFILDKTLDSKGHWEKVVSEDTRWWRVPEELKELGRKAYPLPLESMRCLVRVYKRIGN